jgi:CRISPR-associated endonuclease/helicase Cas3
MRGVLSQALDADHMVADLVAWERMVQRLGRVNRRGEGDAEIKAFWREPSIKDAKAPTESETRASIAFASKAVIESLPQIDDTFDASQTALAGLQKIGFRFEDESGA